MFNYLVNLIVKSRYGTLRQLTVTYSNSTGTGNFRIKTYRGWRWSGVLTVKRLSIINYWVNSGKLVRDVTVGDDHINAITYIPGKSWGFLDIFRFHSLVKLSDQNDTLAYNLDKFYGQ